MSYIQNLRGVNWYQYGVAVVVVGGTYKNNADTVK